MVADGCPRALDRLLVCTFWLAGSRLRRFWGGICAGMVVVGVVDVVRSR